MTTLQAANVQPKRISADERAKHKENNLQLAEADLWTTFDRNTAFSKNGLGMLLGPAL